MLKFTPKNKKEFKHGLFGSFETWLSSDGKEKITFSISSTSVDSSLSIV